MSGPTTFMRGRFHRAEPPSFQFVTQLVELDGIDAGPERAPEDLDAKGAKLGTPLLGREAAPEDRIHDLFEREPAPVRQVAQLGGHVVVERQGGSHR